MKLLLLSSLAGAGVLLLAVTVPQSLLGKQSAALKGAKQLSVAYTVRVAGEKADYTLLYGKPNLMRIEGPNRTIETDGKTFWEYDKAAKTYTESPVTDALIAKRAQGDEVIAWASFFADNWTKKLQDAKVGATRTIKGAQVTEVNATLEGPTPRPITLYIDDKLGIARGFSLQTANGLLLAMADKVELGDTAPSPDKFAFAAPADAKKVEAPVAVAAGWASVQPIFAAHCTPCHNGRGRGGFSISSYASVMKGSEDGPVITPGDPDNSLLIKLITGQAMPKMPPSGAVPQGDIDTLKAWIKAGAKE